MKVCKYQIHPNDGRATLPGAYEIAMPEAAVILSVQEQRQVPCIWAQVHPRAPLQKRKFVVVATGDDIPEDGVHVATWQSMGGVYVWHLFEIQA